MSYSIIGEQISKFRRAKGLTQRELGEAIGISASAVSQWESGGAPDISLLPTLSDVLGVTVDSLFGREEARREDIAEVLGKYILSLPLDKRLPELISLSRRAMIMGCVDRMNDIVDFDRRESQADYIASDGFATAVYSGEMSFICAAKSESGGLGRLIECDERVSALFSALSEDGTLGILLIMYSQAPKYRTVGALARLTGLTSEAAEGILEKFTQLKLAERLQLETEDGAVNAYSITSGSAVISLLAAAKLITDNKSFMKIISDRRTLKPYESEKGEQPC